MMAGASENEDIYGTSTAAGNSKPQINFNRAETGSNFGGDNFTRENSGIAGSSVIESQRVSKPLLLNQPSVDEFAQVDGIVQSS
mmetsp:Transcript_8439/g.14147  ORF Transcript_8439/g.14147 Transcript_8439/m.14147 type:complete len:84 (+) Transcript_8439:631-882(+)